MSSYLIGALDALGWSTNDPDSNNGGSAAVREDAVEARQDELPSRLLAELSTLFPEASLGELEVR